MPRNRLPRVMKRYSPTGRRNHGRPLRDFWIRETGTGQQVAQLHDRYMMMMMMMLMYNNNSNNVVTIACDKVLVFHDCSDFKHPYQLNCILLFR